MVKDICVRESYTSKDGKEHVSWNKIGVLISKNDSEYVKLFHLPGVLCSVFDAKPKKQQTQNDEGVDF